MKLVFKRNKKTDNLRQFRSRLDADKSPTVQSYRTNRISQTHPGKRSRTGSGGISNANSKEAPRVGGVKRWFMLFGLLVFIVIVSAVVLDVNSKTKIVVVEPANFSYYPHTIQQYSDAATAAINSSLFNKFKLTFSSSNIANQLKKDFPEIAYATATIPFVGPTPTVHIQLYRPAAIFISGNGQRLALNIYGYVIANASALTAKEQGELANVSSSDNKIYKLGDQVLTSSNVAFVATVEAALQAKGITVSKMSLVPMAEELDVYPAGVSYYIKFNLNETDALQQVGTYLATIATLKQQQKPMPALYIDVRVNGRAYYK